MAIKHDLARESVRPSASRHVRRRVRAVDVVARATTGSFNRMHNAPKPETAGKRAASRNLWKKPPAALPSPNSKAHASGLDYRGTRL